MSKYYTPRIGEFHVGFEYEAKCPITEEWTDFKIDLSFGSLWFASVNNIRVKHLDQEDIESLGFEYDWANENGFITKDWDGRDLGYKIYTNGWTDPYKVDIHKGKEKVFLGTINNKSELKRILKQIEI